MNLVTSSIPVLFINPVTKAPDQMPVEMISAYVFDSTGLRPEDAAKLATIRDLDAAENFRLSAMECLLLSSDVGCGYDPLAIEPPSLR